MATRTTDHVLSYNPNWLFVTFVTGGFGHQISRCICTSPDVPWYDFPFNGETPWTWNHFTPNFSWGHSLNHFIPWFKDVNGQPKRVSGFGYAQAMHIPATVDLFNKDWMLKIQETQKLLFNSHDTPDYIRSRFPNSKIVLIVIEESDWFSVVKNHIDKSANYSMILKNGQNLLPEVSQWHDSTGHMLIRDWEQYHNKLDQNKWIEWTVNKLKNKMSDMLVSAKDADVVFHSTDRNNIDAIVDLHKKLNIEYDILSIENVLNAFNLDQIIRKHL